MKFVSAATKDRATKDRFRIRAIGMLLAAWIVTGALAARAQTFRGTIRGEVRDASGSILVGAGVTAKNLATNETRSALTAGDGGYVLLELAAGEYEVTATAKDLAPITQKAIVSVAATIASSISFAVFIARVPPRNDKDSPTRVLPQLPAE